MRPWKHFSTFAAAGLLTALALPLFLAFPAAADEGMWLYNGFPFERFEEAYGYRPSQDWLDHVRLSSVRFNSGGSGSFVSADGLTITNHHVGADCIQKLSNAERDLMADGFVAAVPADELGCPDLELNVLVAIDPVTARVRAAAAGKDSAGAAKAIRAERSAIEKECAEKTGLRCDVVELYEGGEYDLYRYRRYTDIRLAFAPEAQLAFFGGDPDNFEYPRFVVDAALFRVYENGEPVSVDHYLSWSTTGPVGGEAAFVSGNPGSTGRLDTLAQLTWLRDTEYPALMDRLNHLRDRVLAFAARGPEQERIAKDDLHGIENAIKAVSGYLSGLLDPALLERKGREEAGLRKEIAGDSDKAADLGDPWREISEALELYRTIYARRGALDGGLGRAGDLARTARTIVRLTAEVEKPNGERLREYRETALPSVFQRLYSAAPIYPEYEEYGLEGALQRFLGQYGPTHPLVIEVFGDHSPAQVAKAAIAGTELGDVAVRKALVEGGLEAVERSDDPLIRLFRTVDPESRAQREIVEDRVRAVTTEAGAKITETYFAVKGKETYPDATFTLRISYGRVLGYEEGGEELPWHTRFGGLYERAEKFGKEAPYDLAPAVAAAKGKLDLSTSLNFVTTNDIIGGNSGSPVINREGEFVGIVFDGNLYMLPNRFVYSDRQSRAISVDSRAILETLRKVYPASHLADELVRGGRKAPAVGDVIRGR